MDFRKIDIKKIDIKKIKTRVRKAKKSFQKSWPVLVEQYLPARRRKILSWLGFGFLIAVLVFVLFPLLPIENNYSLKMVSSGSMEPAIKTGGVIMVKPIAEYQIGDIVTYQYGRYARNLTTHRIIERTDSGFITKGDNNNAADINSVSPEQILGKVFLTVPYAGYMVNFIHSKFGFLLLILVPALIIIGSESFKIYQEIKKMRGRKNRKNKYSLKKMISKIFVLLVVSGGLVTFVSQTDCYFTASIFSANNLFQAGEWTPVLDPIGNQSVEAESLLKFAISATDPNNDSLNYLAFNLPDGATFAGQTFSWTPTADQTGIYPGVRFEVSDEEYTDSESITITVTATSTP